MKKYLTTYFRTPTFREKYGHIGFIFALCDSGYEVVNRPLESNAEYFTSTKDLYQAEDSFSSKSNEIFLFNLIKIESKIKEIQVKALASRSLRYN